MRAHIATGIDIGTYETKVVMAESNPADERTLARIIGTGRAESRGLRHGYIVNVREATGSVMEAVAQAEKTSGVKIRRAFVSIGGMSLASVISTGAAVISRADSEVTDMDMEKAVRAAEKNIPGGQIINRRIIHTVPLSYKIDNKLVFGRPSGMKGNKLETRALFVTCLAQHLNDLVETVTDAGIEVLDIVAGPLASSLVTLSKNQKVAGCLLANIGAETVSIVVFENNLPISLEVFPLGSTDITNDIALGLRTSIEDAENLKRGVLSAVQFPKKKLDEIIDARFSDMFDLMEEHLKKIDRNGLLPAGITLTGGGSSAPLIAETAKTALKLPSRIATLSVNGKDNVKDSIWSVAYGLSVLGAGTEDALDQGFSKNGGGFAKKAGEWLRQFLP
ncbi:MAG: cell division protein FtsA [Patescibacteria group bacterium]